MSVPQDMTGFVGPARAYLRDLAQHNTRDWFRDNKDRYDTAIKRPGLLLLDALTPTLEHLSAARVKPKLFRPHRDMRFSEDKTPYHTHMHMLWSCTDGRGWFFGLSPDYATAGAGIMDFDAAQLDAYRAAVAGAAGADLQARLKELGGRMDPPGLERVPAPFPTDHPREDLLRRKGLVVWLDDLEDALDRGAQAALEQAFTRLAPVQDWLKGL